MQGMLLKSCEELPKGSYLLPVMLQMLVDLRSQLEKLEMKPL